MNFIRNFIKLSGINQISWLNPLLLGILPAVIIILLQPIKFNPFVFSLSESVDNIIWFEDINNNGLKEKFKLTNNMSNSGAIQLYDEEGSLVDQLNFSYPLAKPYTKRKPYAVDFDNDGSKEIIIFTQNKDSLFLNVYNSAKKRIEIENKFVTQIGGFNSKSDFYINWIGHHDVTTDSAPEFYFSVAAGYALYPRRVFRFDFKNSSIISSINTASANLLGTIFQHNDSVAIIVSGAATGNVDKDYPYPYHDTTSWLFNFDKDLKLRFSPESYGGYPGYFGQVIQKDSFAYYTYATVNTLAGKNLLYKMNWDSEKVDSIVFDFSLSSIIDNININGKSIYCFTVQNGEKYLFIETDEFGVHSFKKSGFNNKRMIYQADLDNNGKPEFLIYDPLKNELLLYDQNLRNPFVIAKEKQVLFVTSNYYKKSGYGELITNTFDNSKTYRYQVNLRRNLKFPLWAGIYFISVLFISIILYFQKIRINKQNELEQQLANLQLQNLRSQLDPHFTFNVLNTIGSYIYKQDKEKAYDLFQRFTRIIRSSLMGSDKVFWSLKEEIQFTQDYLEFQKLRFKERFDYTINIDKSIAPDKIQFPKMLIQGFAENAVKHAFFGVDYTGQIGIKISFEDISQNKFRIAIEDNGIGINKSRELKQTSGTQKGLNVLQEQVHQINKLYKLNYKIAITDKSERYSALTGTKATITFPFH